MSFKTADGGSNLKICAQNHLPRSTVFPRTGQIICHLVVFTDFLDTKCNKLSVEISLWRRRLMLYCIKKNKNQADIHSKRQCDQ